MCHCSGSGRDVVKMAMEYKEEVDVLKKTMKKYIEASKLQTGLTSSSSNVEMGIHMAEMGEACMNLLSLAEQKSLEIIISNAGNRMKIVEWLRQDLQEKLTEQKKARVVIQEEVEDMLLQLKRHRSVYPPLA